MDYSKTYDNPSPEVTANIFSRLFYCWLFPLFKYGYKNDLEIKHMYNTSDNDLSGRLGSILNRHWEEELQQSKEKKIPPKLERALIRTFIKPYSLLGLELFVIWVVLKMIQPIVFAMLIQYFDVPRTKAGLEGWLYAIIVVLIAFVIIIISHHVKLGQQRTGMQCRIAVCSLIYKKILRLNKVSVAKTPTGKIVNLLTNDVARFDQLLPYLHFIWIVPIQTVVAVGIMHNSIGYAVFPGIILLLIQAGPLQCYLSKMLGKLRMKIAICTDHRAQLLNEILVGLQVIKMYTWEKPFEKFVTLARKLEIDTITKTTYIRGLQVVLLVFTQRFTLYLTIITYALLENRIVSDKVYSVAQVIEAIHLCLVGFYPVAISLYAECRTTLQRIEDFLLQNEKIETLMNNTNNVPDQEFSKALGSVIIENGTVNWGPNHAMPTLKDINLKIEPGVLCAVVGQVGSGKSSLLQLMLEELPFQNVSHFNVVGKISYASQEPWLFGSTVRNNILFGLPYIKAKYEKIINICALERDINLLPHGDHTLVGERGVSLSGGQRARINMARAVYREADIFLFDDPLSAVDPHVGKHLFEECILKYLENKTRIFVTNQWKFLKQADQIIMINNGQIESISASNEILSEKLSYLRYQENSEATIDDSLDEKENVELLPSTSSFNSDSKYVEGKQPQETQELIEKGVISSSLYTKYFQSGGSLLLLVITAALFIIAQIACNSSDIWVRNWTNLEQKRHADRNNTNLIIDEVNSFVYNTTTNDTIEKLIKTQENSTMLKQILSESNTKNDTIIKNNHINGTSNDFEFTYMYIYTALIFTAIILSLMRTFIFLKICMNASRALHSAMFANVLKAPMRFFAITPSGRILNRFSKDMGAVDEILPRALIDAFQIFLVTFGILIMVFLVNPWMVIPSGILLMLFFCIKNIYLASAQNIKRLEAVSRAPAISHVSATLSGLATIRTCNAEPILTKEFDSLQDQHSQAWFLYLATTEAFGFYLDAAVVIFLALLSMQFLIFDDGTTLSGDVGLVLYQTLSLMGLLQYGMKQTADVANQMTSVERILQYTNLIEEGPFKSMPSKKPPNDWPKYGEIMFKNISLSYAVEDGPVLHNLNIHIKSGEKVGIVGRTGAGKSSLIAALFRLAPTEGLITIDNIDTGSIGLHDLRNKISIIPQEPVLFTTSVKHNMDPLGKCDDLKLWEALEDVELKDVILDLNQQVHHGGSNFSTGQLQLVCLARAIISNNKILIMDEATANIDLQTDHLIQTTIRKNFKDCTVLTIAHRLNTIMDSDKVLVMNAGQVVEFGHPYELLQHHNGYFSSMLKNSGENTEMQLRNIAKESYQKYESTLK